MSIYDRDYMRERDAEHGKALRAFLKEEEMGSSVRAARSKPRQQPQEVSYTEAPDFRSS